MSTAPEHPGRLGVFLGGGTLSPEDLATLAGRIEKGGYSTLWLPEAVGADPFVQLGYLAARTERLILATGIANIYARDALTMNSGAKTMALAAPGRFILGLGVSSPVLVSGVRGHEYQKPLPAMRGYLEAMEKALYRGAEPEHDAPIVLGSLGPLMLGLAAKRTRGAIPFLVPPEHTALARGILGEGPWLCPEQMVLLESDAAVAREVGRKAISSYLTAPGYRSNLERLGFTAEEMDAKSDHLVDALVAWGDESAIHDRIDAHYAAGADHVCVQALQVGPRGPDLELLRRLAPSGKF